MASNEGFQLQGGYDCHFVEDPPEELVCQICTLVAYHPYQASCCGKVFCKICLEEYKKHAPSSASSKFHCPNCRKHAHTFHDKRGSRNIKCLKVKCTNEEFGCQWEGELFYLEKHVKDCLYAMVPCPNDCTTTVPRHALQDHTEKECLLRRYNCPGCGMRGTYRFVIGQHQDECSEAIVPCPNGCGYEPLTRRLVHSHMAVCPNEVVPCTYRDLGCRQVLPRKEMNFHQAEGLQHHLELAVRMISKLKRPIAVSKLSDFSHLKSSGKWWYGPGFYTHPGGYRLCLGVAANGNGNGSGTHLSVYIYRMKGENDENLIWPFRGQVTFQLLNQLQDAEHLARTVPFDFHRSNEFNSRVVKGERSRQGWGFNRFISLGALGYKASALFLKDDCLYFRVVAAEVCASNKPWLSCTS